MVKQFVNLEWKQYFRSSYWQKNVLMNVFLLFFALYFIATFLILGVAMYPLLNKIYPESDPFVVFNGFLFYWILADLLLRFFFQKLPVMSVKPLLTLPVKRRAVINFVLGKSALSFFNFLPLFAFVPFSTMLIANDYPLIKILSWLLALILIVLIINFLNFIIESIASETELPFLPVILIAGGLYALNYFNIISLGDIIGNGLIALSESLYLLIVPAGALVVLYILNFRILKKKLYIDNSLQSKKSEAKTTNLEWTRKFGDIAPFMQLDIRLILRNKRSKSAIWMLVIGLLYGLFFYPNPLYLKWEWFFVFIGIFVTGIFLINFGQFIPAWDSSYYKLLMSQNIKYERYLKSKYSLMMMSVVLMFVLSIPYVFFGWKILLAHFAAAVYNIGVNTYVILWGGSYNRKKIELDQRAAFNFQGTGAVQWLIGIPLMLVPMAIFAIFHFTMGFQAGVIVIIGMGLTGIMFHQRLMKFITRKYMISKHKMIEAFSQAS
ncbi:MAG: hypothetical protein HKO90_01870 [Flavobacteriaceae bacterium]|nr:hypothetical protein [Flavobacteriaceae bacterium]